MRDHSAKIAGNEVVCILNGFSCAPKDDNVRPTQGAKTWLSAGRLALYCAWLRDVQCEILVDSQNRNPSMVSETHEVVFFFLPASSEHCHLTEAWVALQPKALTLSISKQVFARMEPWHLGTRRRWCVVALGLLKLESLQQGVLKRKALSFRDTGDREC